MIASARKNLTVTHLWLFGSALAVFGASHLLTLGSGSQSAVEVRDALHAPAFLVLTVAVVLVLNKRMAVRLNYAAAAAAGLLAGIIGEGLQALGPGDASFVDLGSDILGISTGLLLAASVDRRVPFNRAPGLRIALLLSVLLLLAAIFSAPARYVYGYYSRQNAIPTVYSPTASWQDLFARPSNGSQLRNESCPANWPCKQGQVARVVLGNAEYSGLKIETANEWMHYVTLNVPISAGHDFTHKLTLSISDEYNSMNYSDRFSLHFSVSSEPEILRISIDDILNAPSTRQMDMNNISEMYLFMDAPTGGEEILVGEITLSMR